MILEKNMINPLNPGYDPLNPSVMPENLDLTNRQTIMDAYSKYRQGQPMGPSTADVRMGTMFMGEELPGQSSTSLSNFRKFLENYGIEDRMTYPEGMFQKVGGIEKPNDPIGGNPGLIPPGSDQKIAQPPVNPYAPENPVFGSQKNNPFTQQLTGFGDKLGGFGEQLGGFGNQITGFNEQFTNINNKLQNMEKGISSLTDKLNNQQQTQSSQPYSNPYGGFSNPYGGLQSMLFGNYGGYQSPFTYNYSFY
jgi:hypothetical protein|tara:strand:- start:535 stop:1284 length:750 start_codon:yes stop_codon:yes gene_type:complete